MSQIKIFYKKSEIAEIIGTVSYISDNGHSNIENLSEYLTTESIALFDFINKFPLKGLEIGNILLSIDPFLSVKTFIKKLDSMKEERFIYFLLSEIISIEIIEKSKKNKNVLKEFINSSSYLNQDYFDLAEELIDNVSSIRKNLNTLFIDISAFLKNINTDEYKHTHSKFLKEMKVLLNTLTPLNVAQELMGKKFKRISDYKNFIFIPTYFSKTKCIRYFDDNTLIVLKTITFIEKDFNSLELSSFLKVLSDKTRLEILEYISEKPSYGIELSTKFKVSRPTISFHLEQLKSVGLVNVERVKNTKYYSINKHSYMNYIKKLNNYLLK